MSKNDSPSFYSDGQEIFPEDFNTQSFFDLRSYDQSWFDRGRPNWYILLWWLIQGVIFPLIPHNFNGIRRSILRLFGAKIGINVIIRPTARFTYPWKISIDNYSWIGDDVILYSLDLIHIGKHCIISQKSYLCTGSHDHKDPAFRLITHPITIGNGVWIATDCFIAPNVKIGANTIIGARSSVFHNMPPNYICYGNPCQPRSPRNIQVKS